MSDFQLFFLGLFVTILMCSALAPLVWAAIQDGRYNDAQQELYRDQSRGDPNAPVARPSSISSSR